jgi:hypothetical protein
VGAPESFGERETIRTQRSQRQRRGRRGPRPSERNLFFLCDLRAPFATSAFNLPVSAEVPPPLPSPGGGGSGLPTHAAAWLDWFAASAKPLNRFFFRWTSSSEIAAGVTPEIREARPSVSGRCLLSFCRTSMLRAATCM